MPNWKKVIVSGSNVSQLNNDGVYLRTTGDGVISSSAQIATQISGAFTATSASLSGRISSLSSSSTTFAGTGSNTFKGDQTFSGSLLPETTEVFTLGSPDKVWESLYVDGQSIYMRDVATNTFVTMSANAGVLTFNNTRLNVPLGITSSNLILTSIVNAGTDTDKFLVLDTNGNVDFRTGTEILSDINAASSSIKNYIDFNNLVDFKTLTQGFAPMCGITDIQETDNSPFSNWLAPSDGYIERIELMVGETNTVSGSFSIRGYKNGSTLGVAVSQSQGAARTVTEYVYGSSFSFSKKDRLGFFMDKTTNTSDLYTFNIYFQVGN